MCTESQYSTSAARGVGVPYELSVAANMSKQITFKNLFDSEWTDEQRIQFLVSQVRKLDREGKMILAEAEQLKAVYDRINLEAAEARGHLLRYGIKIDNTEGE